MPPKKNYMYRVFTRSRLLSPVSPHRGRQGFQGVIEKALELGGYAEDKQMHGINGGRHDHRLRTGDRLSFAGKVIEQ
jgi:hydroxylamine reductase